MVDDTAIDFLGNSIVVTPVPRFHVKHGNAASSGSDRRESAVRVAEDQDFVRLVLGESLIRLTDDLTDLLAEAIRSYPEVNIRRADLEIANKNIAQALVIILPGMNCDVVAVLIENLHHQAKPDYFGTRPEYRHDLHRNYFPAV